MNTRFLALHAWLAHLCEVLDYLWPTYLQKMSLCCIIHHRDVTPRTLRPMVLKKALVKLFPWGL